MLVFNKLKMISHQTYWMMFLTWEGISTTDRG